MVTDQEISRCVESLLRQSPPGSVTSVSAVVSEVSSQLGGLDLTHKAAFIRDHIQSLLFPPPPPPQKDHFALQTNPQQFQFHPSHFPNYPQQHQQQQGPVTAQFGYRLSPPPPTQPPQFQLIQQQKQAVSSQPVVRPVSVATAGPSPKESSRAGVKRRGGPGGLSKVCGVSPELQAIVGEPTMARTQIVKQLWAYIRKNNLQDPANKRKIICNDELRLVFETDCTDMFKMNKLLAKHILPLDPTKDSGPDSKRLKVTAAADVSSATGTDTKNFSVVVSDALADFFGTGEREMLESEALRRVWDYIKANNLQDPVNTMVISCDTKLQQLFGCEKLLALGIVEMLSRHFKQC